MFVQVESDFDVMFPDKGNMMFEHWPKLADKVLSLVRANVKDKNVLVHLDFADADKGEVNLNVSFICHI